MKKWSAAIDPSLNRAALAVLDNGQVALRSSVPMKGRDGAGLAVFILDELKKLDLDLTDIAGWSVGSGPGSFTGLRLAAALVAGWTFDRPETNARCVPSAYALAAGLDTAAPGDTVGCLYDGRNREVLYYQTRRLAGGWESTGDVAVLNRDTAAVFFSSRPAEKLAVYAAEAETVLPLLPAGLETVRVTSPRTEVLALNPTPDFDNDLTRLVYIRPAVYSV